MKDIYDIRTLCKAVKLHHSVYYYHKQNKENSYKKANEELDKKIIEEFEKSRKRYGSPKITKILNKQGIKVSQKRVARRMKLLKLRSITVKKFNHNGNKKVDDKDKENLLDQNFNAKKPGEKWVGDITYIYTKEKGWTYLAIVMDLYSMSVIGYSYGDTMDAELVIKAIQNARTKGKFKWKIWFAKSPKSTRKKRNKGKPKKSSKKNEENGAKINNSEKIQTEWK